MKLTLIALLCALALHADTFVVEKYVTISSGATATVPLPSDSSGYMMSCRIVPQKASDAGQITAAASGTTLTVTTAASDYPISAAISCTFTK